MHTRVTYNEWQQISHTFAYDNDFKGARSVLEWAYQVYATEQLVYASSFGAEAIVLIDFIAQIQSDAHVVFLDTGLHFPETYKLIEVIEGRYPLLQIERKKPVLSLEEQAKQYGTDLWRGNPNQCCQMRKVAPLQEVMTKKVGWISGLRREQSPTRASTEFINKDEKFLNIKICPLIYWTWDDVWSYIRLRNLPYNELHDQQYPSIGCYPCTMPVSAVSDYRAGRWAGLGKTECGLHTRT